MPVNKKITFDYVWFSLGYFLKVNFSYARLVYKSIIILSVNLNLEWR